MDFYDRALYGILTGNSTGHTIGIECVSAIIFTGVKESFRLLFPLNSSHHWSKCALYDEWKTREPLVFEYDNDLPDDTGAVDDKNKNDSDDDNEEVDNFVMAWKLSAILELKQQKRTLSTNLLYHVI